MTLSTLPLPSLLAYLDGWSFYRSGQGSIPLGRDTAYLTMFWRGVDAAARGQQ